MSIKVERGKNLKAVLDTNILISALVFGGKPRAVMHWLVENGSIYISQDILTETRRIIHAKFPNFLIDLARLEKLLKRDALCIVLGSIEVDICQDQDDNMIIETALLGRCQYIISGDHHLLALKCYQKIEIETPARFLNIIDQW